MIHRRRKDPQGLPILVRALLYYLSSIPTLLDYFLNWRDLARLISPLDLSTPVTLQLDSPTIRLRVNKLMEAWVAKEVYSDQCYMPRGFTLGDPGIILDIGAGLGDFSVLMSSQFPDAEVYAFEPYPPSFQRLLENIALNELENVHAFPYAIGAHKGITSLYIHALRSCEHSTVPMGGFAGEQRIPVQSRTLDLVFQALSIATCDLVKIDVEGAEYEILFSASRGTLSRIRHISAEYHEGVANYSRLDLANYLQNEGFEVEVVPNSVHRNLGLIFARNTHSHFGMLPRRRAA